MHHMKRSLLLCAVAALSAGCSFTTGSQSPGDAAVELIEGELGAQSGLEYVDIDCTEPAENEIGAMFACTASVIDDAGPNAGALVDFIGVLEDDKQIFVAPSNIISPDEMALVEQEAAAVLSEEVGAAIAPEDVVCPEQVTVLVDDQMSCEITDTATGDRYEMILTATEFALREGFGSRFYEVGELLG